MKKTLLAVAACSIFIGQPMAQPSFYPQDVQNVCSAIPEIGLRPEDYLTNEEAAKKYSEQEDEQYVAKAKCAIAQLDYLKAQVETEYNKVLARTKDKVALKKSQDQFERGNMVPEAEAGHAIGFPAGETEKEIPLEKYYYAEADRFSYA
ncbi:MAG: hypothetical protein LUC43_00575, partial [Burkholderiales bacterium]|nr:hypothetical protein [Burkholderiales bacterium]